MGRHEPSPEWRRLQELREAEAASKSQAGAGGFDPGEVLFEAPRGQGQMLRLARRTYQGKPKP